MEHKITELKQLINKSIKNQRHKEFVFKWVNISIIPYLNQPSPKIKMSVFLLVKLQKDLSMEKDEATVLQKLKTWNDFVKKLKNTKDDNKKILGYSEWSMIAPEYNNYEEFCTEFFSELVEVQKSKLNEAETNSCEKAGCDKKCYSKCELRILDDIDLKNETLLKSIEKNKSIIDQQFAELRNNEILRQQKEIEINLRIKNNNRADVKNDYKIQNLAFSGVNESSSCEDHEGKNNDEIQNSASRSENESSSSEDNEAQNDEKIVQKITESDRIGYEGDYIDGEKNGKGVYFYSNGNYKGQWKNDQKHGEGVYTWKNGNKYEGEWKDGQMNGKGVSFYSNGNYEGQWKNDQKHGKGVYSWKNGNKYEGEWKDDQITGEGIFTWKNGDKYVGELLNGEKNGKGVKYSKNGKKYEGEWKDDQMNGKGLYFYSNGYYDGQWKKGEENGKGVYTWKNGNKYEGEWLNGSRHGTGVMYYKDGTKYVGEWKDDKKHGKGVTLKQHY